MHPLQTLFTQALAHSQTLPPYASEGEAKADRLKLYRARKKFSKTCPEILGVTIKLTRKAEGFFLILESPQANPFIQRISSIASPKEFLDPPKAPDFDFLQGREEKPSEDTGYY